MKKLLHTKQKLIIAFTVAVVAVASYYLITFREDTPAKQIVKTKVISKKSIQYPDTISGEIITLKKLSMDHVYNYFKAFSPKVRKFLEFPEKVTISYVEEHMQLEIDQMNQGVKIVCSIWDKKENKFIGEIQIRNKDEDEPGQLGMWLNENFWGGGRIQEAMKLISKVYFDRHQNENDYIAFVRPWNIRSIKSMEKFGFKFVRESAYEDKKVKVYKISRDVIAKKF